MLLMDENYLKEIEKTWDSIAKSFDKTRRKTWQECIDFIDNTQKNGTIVDIGSGNGRHLIPSAIHCKHAIGIDISNEMLKVVQEKLNDEKISNVNLIHSAAENIPLKSGSMDLIWMSNVYHHLEDYADACREMYRILTSKGNLVIRNGTQETDSEIIWNRFFPEAIEFVLSPWWNL